MVTQKRLRRPWIGAPKQLMLWHVRLSKLCVRNTIYLFLILCDCVIIYVISTSVFATLKGLGIQYDALKVLVVLLISLFWCNKSKTFILTYFTKFNAQLFKNLCLVFTVIYFTGTSQRNTTNRQWVSHMGQIYYLLWNYK